MSPGARLSPFPHEDGAASPLTTAMQVDLDRLHRRLGKDPEQELAALLLLALEREQLVTVGYSDDRLLARLQHSGLSQRLQAAFGHALQQIWKEEERHARYLHGILLRQPTLGVRLRSSLQHLTGMVGGWTLATQQLKRWRTAPLQHAVAAAMETVGTLSGQILPAARAGMRYQTLRSYATFNLDAELSAVLGYDWIIALVATITREGARLLVLPGNFQYEMEQTRLSELEHVRLFTLMRDAVTDQDQLREGVDEDALVAALSAISETYVAPADRGLDSVRLGRGGPVWVVQGDAVAEKLARFELLLDASDLDALFNERAQELGKPVAALRVAVKIDLMLGYDRVDPSTVSDPEVAELLAIYLRGRGVTEVALVDSRNYYQRYFQHRDVATVGRYFGFTSPHYRLVDLSDEQEQHAFRRGMGQEAIGRTWRDADVRISLARLKTNPVVQFALTLWNQETIVPQEGTFLFGDRVADFSSAVVALLSEFPVHFGIIDGYAAAADGLTGFLACPRPRSPLRFYAGRDLLAVDAVAARHMGVQRPRVSQTYNEATYWFGDPQAAGTIAVLGTDQPIRPWRSARHGLRGRVLQPIARSVYQQLSGHGALFVGRMDPRAFPPVGERVWLRAARRGVWWLLGI